MLVLGSLMVVSGFALLWFEPYTGAITMIIGLGIIWSFEEQKIKQKNEKEKYDEENEKQYDELKYQEPLSAKLFETATLLHGTIKPHEAWLLRTLNSFEEMYAVDPKQAIIETQNTKTGKYKSLFSSAIKYREISEFFKRDVSDEIFEDIEIAVKQLESDLQKVKETEEEPRIPTLTEILEEEEIGEWVKTQIKAQIKSSSDRNQIIENVTALAKTELNKDISLARIRDEWIVNGTVRFKI